MYRVYETCQHMNINVDKKFLPQVSINYVLTALGEFICSILDFFIIFGRKKEKQWWGGEGG